MGRGSRGLWVSSLIGQMGRGSQCVWPIVSSDKNDAVNGQNRAAGNNVTNTRYSRRCDRCSDSCSDSCSDALSTWRSQPQTGMLLPRRTERITSRGRFISTLRRWRQHTLQLDVIANRSPRDAGTSLNFGGQVIFSKLSGISPSGISLDLHDSVNMTPHQVNTYTHASVIHLGWIICKLHSKSQIPLR